MHFVGNTSLASELNYQHGTIIRTMIHVTPTFKHAWATPGHSVVIGGS